MYACVCMYIQKMIIQIYSDWVSVVVEGPSHRRIDTHTHTNPSRTWWNDWPVVGDKDAHTHTKTEPGSLSWNGWRPADCWWWKRWLCGCRESRRQRQAPVSLHVRVHKHTNKRKSRRQRPAPVLCTWAKWKEKRTYTHTHTHWRAREHTHTHINEPERMMWQKWCSVA